MSRIQDLQRQEDALRAERRKAEQMVSAGKAKQSEVDRVVRAIDQVRKEINAEMRKK